jgi:putative glutamine amidotransferase
MKHIININNMLKKFSVFTVLTMLLLLSVYLCNCNIFGKEPKIAFSKGGEHKGYENYYDYIKKVEPGVRLVDLYDMKYDDAVKELKSCEGLVLTGGPDVFPGRYGKAFDSSRCEIDYRRDTLEFMLIKKALELKMPLLAICRGEQILNVALGGSLIVDIPKDYDTLVTHRCGNPDSCYHEIKVREGTLLYKITKVNLANVNSNHHQAVDRLADSLIVTARTRDGLIEAYEWEKPDSKPFMLAVQWHPERLDTANPMSLPIGRYFIEETKKYKQVK